MKRILFILTLLAVGLTAVAQTGTGWYKEQRKLNHRDSAYFAKDANFIEPIRIDGISVTSGAVELNILDGALCNFTELNYLVGVSSNIQTQLNTKQATLVSGTSIKTINGESLLGAGNIDIDSTGTSMVYPGTGIALATAEGAWGTSITNNSVNWDTAYVARLRWNGGSTGLTAATGRTSLGGTTVGQSMFTLTNPSAITFPRFNANNTVTALSAANYKTALSLAAADVGLGNVTNESKATMLTSPVITGHATIEGVTLTGRTGTGNLVFSASPTLTGTLTGTFSGNLTGDVTGTASLVTGFTRNAGSLTLSGGHGITLTTTGTTGVTLPTSGTLATTTTAVMRTDSTGHAVGNYMPRNSTENLVNDTILARIDVAIEGLAVADSNTYEGYPTRYWVESMLGDGGGGSLSAKRLPFIIGTTTGAPTTADSTVTHPDIAGKHVDIYRDGAKQYQNFTATNTVEGFRVSGSIITVYPLWQDGEQILIDIIAPVLWSYLSFSGVGELGELTDSLLSYWRMDDISGNMVDALGYKNLVINGAPTPQQAGKINYCWSYDGIDDFHGVNDTLSLNHRDKFTASAWVKTAAITSDGSIIGAIDGAGNTWGWRVSCTATQTVMSFYDGTTSYVRTAATDISDQAWHHVAVTYNGTNAQLYIDGSPAGAVLAADVAYAAYAFFRINRSDGEYLDAFIDNAAYWHKCLSAAEVSTLYAAENAGIGYPWQ